MEECKYKEAFTQRLDKHEEEIKDNDDRIRELEKYRSGTEEQIKNLVEKINSLVTTMRWFIGLIVGAFVGFFFYAAQSGLIGRWLYE